MPFQNAGKHRQMNESFWVQGNVDWELHVVNIQTRWTTQMVWPCLCRVTWDTVNTADEGKKSSIWFLNLQILSTWKNQSWCSTVNVLTLVTTDKMAIPLRISCQTPMLCAFAATGLLYWVVNFQESTRISRILFIRARRGARGKDATKRVMNPNWMTARERREVSKAVPTRAPSGWQWDNETCKLPLENK